ncbi:hypothetical protein J3F83DRAFT_3269 [Trichoderma novae-zelandiae]
MSLAVRPIENPSVMWCSGLSRDVGDNVSQCPESSALCCCHINSTPRLNLKPWKIVHHQVSLSAANETAARTPQSSRLSIVVLVPTNLQHPLYNGSCDYRRGLSCRVGCFGLCCLMKDERLSPSQSSLLNSGINNLVDCIVIHPPIMLPLLHPLFPSRSYILPPNSFQHLFQSIPALSPVTITCLHPPIHALTCPSSRNRPPNPAKNTPPSPKRHSE